MFDLDELLKDDAPAENAGANASTDGTQGEREPEPVSTSVGAALDNTQIVDFLNFLKINNLNKKLKLVLARIEDGHVPVKIDLTSGDVTAYEAGEVNAERAEKILAKFHRQEAEIDRQIVEDRIEDKGLYIQTVHDAINNYVEPQHRGLFRHFAELVSYDRVFCDSIIERDSGFYTRLMEFDLVDFAIQRNTSSQLAEINSTLVAILEELERQRQDR